MRSKITDLILSAHEPKLTIVDASVSLLIFLLLPSMNLDYMLARKFPWSHYMKCYERKTLARHPLHPWFGNSTFFVSVEIPSDAAKYGCISFIHRFQRWGFEVLHTFPLDRLLDTIYIKNINLTTVHTEDLSSQLRGWNKQLKTISGPTHQSITIRFKIRKSEWKLAIKQRHVSLKSEQKHFYQILLAISPCYISSSGLGQKHETSDMKHQMT